MDLKYKKLFAVRFAKVRGSTDLKMHQVVRLGTEYLSPVTTSRLCKTAANGVLSLKSKQLHK